jgi:hypothetical protein
MTLGENLRCNPQLFLLFIWDYRGVNRALEL